MIFPRAFTLRRQKRDVWLFSDIGLGTKVQNLVTLWYRTVAGLGVSIKVAVAINVTSVNYLCVS
jgi:hypothetical protein